MTTFIAMLNYFLYFTVVLILFNFPPGPYIYIVSKLFDFIIFIHPFFLLLMTSSPSFMAKSYYVMTSNPNFNLHSLVFIKHWIALKRILSTPWKEKFSRTHLWSLFVDFYKNRISNFPESYEPHDLDDKGWLE